MSYSSQSFVSSCLRLGIVAQSTYFDDYSCHLLDSLPTATFSATQLQEIPTGRSEFDIVLVIGIHEHMDLPLRRDYLLVGIQTEQLPCNPTHESRILRNLRRFRAIRDSYDHLFEWSPGIYFTITKFVLFHLRATLFRGTSLGHT